MLTVRKMRKDELKRFKELEGECHHMGETRSGGDTLRLVADGDGERAALMVRGSACYRLKDRDAYIGWAASLRARRQKLVVQNRRFTLLAKRGERPNLASRGLDPGARGPAPAPARARRQVHPRRRRTRLAGGGRDRRAGRDGGRVAEGGRGGEVRAGGRPRPRPGDGPLSGALVSADALHCQQEAVREITLSGGGEALVQVKGNQKKILAACEAVAAGRAPLFVPDR